MGLIYIFGPVDASSDEDKAVAVDHRGADAGAIRKVFEPRHG
jgi:hypothetical protein